MTIHKAQQQLLFQLSHLYDNREAATIADWVMEHITGWKKIDRIMHKQVPLNLLQVKQLTQFAEALVQHKPVQYVLNEAWFYGMKFFVNEQVLIPRPETEELVQWIVQDVREKNFPEAGLTIVDIGTGSGCIPIALKKDLPSASIYACDVSEDALAVATLNATELQMPVNFIALDILNSANWDQIPAAEILVSNPPYIPLKDQPTMRENVLQFEPHLALFVADDDPLLFYKVIAELAQIKLMPGGVVYVEIHEDQGDATQQLFLGKGFTNVVLKTDLQGKDRMIRSSR